MSNPYRRKIPQGDDGLSDVYDVLVAFGVTCPATQHALKKLLLPGVRTGGKSKAQDVQEAIQALQRAVELAGTPKTPIVFDMHSLDCPCDRCLARRRELNCPPKTPVLEMEACPNCGSTDGCRCLILPQVPEVPVKLSSGHTVHPSGCQCMLCVN